MKRYSALAVSVVVALSTGVARAEFGNAGDVSFSADRLMGFYIYDEGNYEPIGFGLGISPTIGRYDSARFGVDGVIVSHLTLGGNLGIAHRGGDRRDDTGVLIYPRVGYVIGFDDTFGFWPRGGITFSNYDLGPGDDEEMALSFEAVFFAAPIEHFGFTFGPNVDIGVVGDGPEARSFGIVAGGVFGWL